jgi:hypothetical protein
MSAAGGPFDSFSWTLRRMRVEPVGAGVLLRFALFAHRREDRAAVVMEPLRCGGTEETIGEGWEQRVVSDAGAADELFARAARCCSRSARRRNGWF